jgi:hypothetical protein
VSAALADLSAAPVSWFEWHACHRRATTDGPTFEFLVSPDARRIEYRTLGRVSSESLATYLLGQVLSFALLSRGYEPLHATAVVIDGQAIAFLGDCGHGKSTLGAGLIARGFGLLTDDCRARAAERRGWRCGPPRGCSPSQKLPAIQPHRSSTCTAKLCCGSPRQIVSRQSRCGAYLLPDPEGRARKPIEPSRCRTHCRADRRH